jgi:hypothetical protein
MGAQPQVTRQIKIIKAPIHGNPWWKTRDMPRDKFREPAIRCLDKLKGVTFHAGGWPKPYPSYLLRLRTAPG